MCDARYVRLSRWHGMCVSVSVCDRVALCCPFSHVDGGGVGDEKISRHIWVNNWVTTCNASRVRGSYVSLYIICYIRTFSFVPHFLFSHINIHIFIFEHPHTHTNSNQYNKVYLFLFSYRSKKNDQKKQTKKHFKNELIKKKTFFCI